MKEISEELLIQIEELSSLMLSKKQIAVIIEFNQQDFKALLKDEDDAPYLRFQRGRLVQEAEVRKSIMELAKNGSSPAQAFAFKLIENAKMDDL